MTPEHRRQQQQQQLVGCGVRSVDTGLTQQRACAPHCWRGCGQSKGWNEKWKEERRRGGEHAVVRRRHVARWGQLMLIRIQSRQSTRSLVDLHPLTLLWISAFASNCYVRKIRKIKHITKTNGRTCQSLLNVFGGPGPARLMGPLSSLWPTWRGGGRSTLYQRIRQYFLGPNQGQTWCQITIYEMELNLLVSAWETLSNI